MPEFDSPAAMTEISSMDGEQLSVRVPLLPGWDASLTYDLLDDPNESIPKGIFVGRGTLLGPLVNALAQPHQRGTYLISGYRGVGKTSLIIEAMLRARGELENRDWSLLPIVLNVSEVSASLSSASDAEQVELAIDARKLLTALLRAIRNHLSREEERRLPPVDGKATSTDARKLLTARLRALRKRFSRQEQPRPPSIADKVMSTYRKAESTRFTYTQTQRTEALVTVAKEKTRAFQVADVMKLLGAGLLLAAIVAEGTVWLGAIDQFHAAAVALAGLAVLSFGSSRVMKQTKSNTDADTFELVFDNSLHQLESELKDILEDLNKEKRRTVIVLEELDKIDDDQGRQLESVIRYFKNLFTQAPALFFFVTDKYYYDAVGNRIDAERAKGSYAIEHTFFTHRIFVVRPGIEECLSYLREIFVADQAVAEVDLIARFSESRSRPIADMSPLEKCLRVLLFRSQGHFFDLKNQLRQFVRVDGEQATLEFDDALMSQSEQALAAFQFLVEQKMHTYRFGGGRDYANEALRSCLFAVFDQMGSQQGRDIGSLYPAEGYIGERLSLSERSRIIEALDTLVEDLERGKSLERHQRRGLEIHLEQNRPSDVVCSCRTARAPRADLGCRVVAHVSHCARLGDGQASSSPSPFRGHCHRGRAAV